MSSGVQICIMLNTYNSYCDDLNHLPIKHFSLEDQDEVMAWHILPFIMFLVTNTNAVSKQLSMRLVQSHTWHLMTIANSATLVGKWNSVYSLYALQTPIFYTNFQSPPMTQGLWLSSDWHCTRQVAIDLFTIVKQPEGHVTLGKISPHLNITYQCIQLEIPIHYFIEFNHVKKFISNIQKKQDFPALPSVRRGWRIIINLHNWGNS